MDTSAFNYSQKPRPCKLCSKGTRLIGSVDFNKVAIDPSPFPRSGIMIKIIQCQHCGFAWAPLFDKWTPETFATHIYNDDIDIIETRENSVGRTQNVSDMLQRYFTPALGLDILDYGCGPGLLTEALCELGFRAQGYDPYYPAFALPPQGLFDVITCFEVLEHCHQPQKTLEQMLGFLKPGGIMILGTFLTQVPIDLDWWYCTPRSGHIAFYTPTALAHLFARHQMQVSTDGVVFHVAFGKDSSALTQHIFKPN